MLPIAQVVFEQPFLGVDGGPSAGTVSALPALGVGEGVSSVLSGSSGVQKALSMHQQMPCTTRSYTSKLRELRALSSLRVQVPSSVLP